MPTTKFTNGLLLKDGQLISGDLWVSSDTGRVVSPQAAFYSAHKKADQTIDLQGKILAPGFIEVQLNGSNNFDFALPDPNYGAKFQDVCRTLIKTGVTSFTPTVTTSTPEVYQTNLPHLAKSTSRNAADGTECLGAHVEGPFLNPTKNGIHTPSILRKAETWSDIESCYGAANLKHIRYITAAPELGNMMQLIRDIIKHDIIYAIGHSDATFEQAREALKAGATTVTHMFNAMRPFGHRDPGIFGLLGQSTSKPSTPTQSPKLNPTHLPALQSPHHSISASPLSPRLGRPGSPISRPRTPPSPTFSNSKRTSPRSSLSISTTPSDLDDDLALANLKPPFFGLISDGIHLAPPAIKIAYNAHPTGCILVTDAMKLCGCPDGVYDWTNGERIIKKGALLTLEKNGRIAGSAIELLECVNNFLEFTGCEVGEGLRCVTETPARMLGGDVVARKGVLEIGFDADLVVLDQLPGKNGEGVKLELEQVWKFGTRVV